jgi:hypothetical protein
MSLFHNPTYIYSRFQLLRCQLRFISNILHNADSAFRERCCNHPHDCNSWVVIHGNCSLSSWKCNQKRFFRVVVRGWGCLRTEKLTNFLDQGGLSYLSKKLYKLKGNDVCTNNLIDTQRTLIYCLERTWVRTWVQQEEEIVIRASQTSSYTVSKPDCHVAISYVDSSIMLDCRITISRISSCCFHRWIVAQSQSHHSPYMTMRTVLILLRPCCGGHRKPYSHELLPGMGRCVITTTNCGSRGQRQNHRWFHKARIKASINHKTSHHS